ncbi:MAG: hypothetical protein IJE97_06170, partial [Thermoguttaceae bacterium]|nr:hypothetical protein [Thermoguttaceae bacterium]
GLRAFGVGALTLTVVFFAFFLTRDQGDRNYGGMSCWSRWFFPLVPLFIPALLPIVDKASNRDVYAASRWLFSFGRRRRRRSRLGTLGSRLGFTISPSIGVG